VTPGLENTQRRAIAVATATLPLGALMAYLAIAAPTAARTTGFLVPAATCVGASVLGAFLAARARSTRRATVMVAAACGALVTVVHLVAGVRNPIFLDGWFALFALAHALGGALLGAALGATASVVVGRVDDARDAPSLDSADRVLLASAAWLGLGATIAWLWRAAPLVHVAAAALLVIAATGLLLVLARDVRRLTWLDAVMRGRLALWTVVADDDSGAPGSVVPRFAAYDDSALDGFLVRDDGAGPRRIAEIPRDRGQARAPIVRRMVIVAVAAAAAGISLGCALRGLPAA
jgi:hypothetical protein